MTENLLQKLEEKMMLILAEVEDARKEIHRLTNENSLLKNDRESHAKKLQDLISLLDAVNSNEAPKVDNIAIINHHFAQDAQG